MGTPGYTSYQGRTQWYIDHWGPHAGVKEATMEDGATKLGVMVFPIRETGTPTRRLWTYATNGMSERRMPWEEGPEGDPWRRLELVAYASEPAEWIADLLIELARYPFSYRCGLEIGHTLPVAAHPGAIWSGYLLAHPRLEPEAFNPMTIDINIGEDSVFFAQVLGLLADELDEAIEIGGPEFETQILTAGCDPDPSPLDIRRESLLRGRR